MAQRDFKREERAVEALIASSAVLVVGGAVSQFLEISPDLAAALKVLLVLAFAAMCGFSLWVANIAAACAQTLAKYRADYPVAFWIALITAGLTGLVSVIGVDLAWMTMIGERQQFPATIWIIGAGFAIGFVKVAMGFVVAACRAIEGAVDQAADQLLAERSRRINELERELAQTQQKLAQAEALAEKKPRQDKPVRPSPAQAARAGRALARELAGQEPQGPSKRHDATATELVGGQARDVTLAEIETACREIWARPDASGEPTTPSLRLVASQIDVPRSRIDKALLQAQRKLADIAEQVRPLAA